MATVTIYLKLVNGVLSLRDSNGGTGNLTYVSKNDNVVWEKDADSEISSITSVAKNSDSQDIFSDDPKLKNDGTWKGKVSSTASGDETYSIGFQAATGAGNHDPKLQIH